jgi:dsRNA-specific ribonuclease
LPLISLNYNRLSANNCRFQPSPDLLFQSITRHSADEKTDMENLEILGDCFLKLAMSMSLYHKYPSDGAGKLTPKKDKQVSNANLYQLAMKKELKNYLYFNRLNFGGTEANWLPPGFTVDEVNAERYTKQKAKRKAFADMIEALIGTFLISTDYFTTIKFMKWLGLDVIPIDEQGKNRILFLFYRR